MLSSRKRAASGEFEQPPKKKIKLSNGQNNPSSHVAMIRKGSAQKPVKKLVIKSFKVRPTLPTNFEEESWSALQDAIHAIQEKKPVSHSKQTLYDIVVNICTHKLAEPFYLRLKAECEKHIQAQRSSLKGQSGEHLFYLKLVDDCWRDHCQQMLMLRDIFLHLDRTYVMQSTNMRSLWDMGMILFREFVMIDDEIRNKTISGILHLIREEREGQAVDRILLRNLLRMFSSLQIYTSEFEGLFFEETISFYKEEGRRRIDQLDTTEYLRHVEQRLVEENERVQHYLEPDTRRRLVSIVEQQLIAEHVSLLLDKGFNHMMDDNRIEDLRRLYLLLSRVDGLKALKNYANIYIKNAGLDIVMHEDKDAQMVDDLLTYKNKLDQITEQAFNNNPEFTYSLKEAFESFINKRANRPAELVAKFVDKKLRSGHRGLTEEELEVLLDRVMVIFRYIQGKDVFEAFYKKDLAKRLLLGKSASLDMEKLMISKLKHECGSGFTSKLENMFKDMSLSKDIMASFRDSSKSQEKMSSDIELNVFVLTTGIWPNYQPMDVRLPEELAGIQDVFKDFYLQKYNGRRLAWQNSMGHCILKAYFPSGAKELCVSLFQAVILLLFNKTPKLDYKDIKSATGIEDEELRRTLQSLACGKVRVLVKPAKGKDITTEDVFYWNKTFSAKLYRLKINSIQIEETKEEQEKTNEGVFLDRQYQIDAAIVRIMKARKSLSHTLLMSELYSTLKFPFAPADIQKRIDSLIEREYLERDSANRNVYLYLA